jgi:hypothetical protein
VQLSISDTEITMHADETELGSWPATAVTIRPIDESRFEFTAEGDQLILTPDDAAALRELPLVAAHIVTTDDRKSRKSKKRAEKKEASSRKKQAAHKTSKTTKPPKEKPPKPSRRARKGETKGPKQKRDGMWIRSLDVARKYDLLGLDRVQIDEELRGHEHQHTWDHRVAAASGPGNHICTICGKIRARTG